MTRTMSSLRDYVGQVAAEHDLSAVTLQVCDKTGDRHRIFQLFNFNVPESASWTYEARKVFFEDPFTNVDLNEASDVAGSDDPIPAYDPRIQMRRPDCPGFWSFLEHFNLTVEGVSTRRLRRGVYLIAGFLRDDRRSYAAPISVSGLGEHCTEIHDMMSAEVLRAVVGSNAGLMGLQKVLEPLSAPSPPTTATGLLSAREMQIADLVGQGRRSKEVAHALSLSTYTVENHLRRIYEKLGIHNRAALARLIH